MKKVNHRRLFWLQVVIGDGCWERGGTKANGGYSILRVQGRGVRAHRYSYGAFIGPIPEGMFVCHRCDNPACVRPDHLFLGTPKDNSQDMIRKGRNMHLTKPETLARGDRNGTRTQPETVRKGERIEWHVLTEKTASECRQRYWVFGEDAVSLANEFHVYKSTIYKCIYGFTWKHLPMPEEASEVAKTRNSTPRHKYHSVN